MAHGYRLPSGPEWGYSCRAGVATMFPFGEDATFLPDYANVLYRRAVPGGNYLPNDWGLFDMLANVWDMSLKPPPGRTPFDPATTTVVLCGGTYGTALSATLPKALANWGNLTAVEMKVSRRYRSAGGAHSYVNAGCPAPKGFIDSLDEDRVAEVSPGVMPVSSLNNVQPRL